MATWTKTCQGRTGRPRAIANTGFPAIRGSRQARSVLGQTLPTTSSQAGGVRETARDRDYAAGFYSCAFGIAFFPFAGASFNSRM